MITIGIPTLKDRAEIQKQIDEINCYPPDCEYEVIASCIKQSAAKNRNWVIDNAKYDKIIMIDDDITGFYDGWYKPLVGNLDKYSIVSARPIDKNGKIAPTLGDCSNKEVCGLYQVCIHTEKTGLNVCCSSCIAFKTSSGVRFDENYKAAVWEDFDFCLEMKKQHPDKDIVFANKCNVVHLNAMQGRTSDDIRFNHKYCKEKWGIEI
jgi:hypothetical protein